MGNVHRKIVVFLSMTKNESKTTRYGRCSNKHNRAKNSFNRIAVTAIILLIAAATYLLSSIGSRQESDSGPIFETTTQSNMVNADYVGAAACIKCHRQKYQDWLKHPHSRMNTVATEETVRADFSGQTLNYLGGTMRFYKEEGKFRMHLIKEDIERIYEVRQTIGSKYYQFFAGQQLEGPELIESNDFILPAGYSQVQKEWVPRLDFRFSDGEERDIYANPLVRPYGRDCAGCHTTYAHGDWMVRKVAHKSLNWYGRNKLFKFDLVDYLTNSHAYVLARAQSADNYKTEQNLADSFLNMDSQQTTSALGVSCEVCHGGCKEHASNEKVLPVSFPVGNNFEILKTNDNPRRHFDKADWVCSRCHGGPVPASQHYPLGNRYWNSTEFTDAEKGACMTELTCMHCHDPHRGGGGEFWNLSGDQEDSLCLQCHSEFDDEMKISSHTHHKAQSPGSRCMNCHMPKITEGFHRTIRTHTIYSPNNVLMLSTLQPNACNLCHIKKSVHWTALHLEEWYGKELELARDEGEMAHKPAGIAWLQSYLAPTMLVAANALADTDSKWALDELVKQLNYRWFYNRQHTQHSLERMLGVRLTKWGYQHYQQKAERRRHIASIRSAILKSE
jgi:predicted CXXCH cytochrome family protein